MRLLQCFPTHTHSLIVNLGPCEWENAGRSQEKRFTFEQSCYFKYFNQMIPNSTGGSRILELFTSQLQQGLPK